MKMKKKDKNRTNTRFFEDNIWTFLRLEDISGTKPGFGRTLIGQTLDKDKG